MKNKMTKEEALIKVKGYLTDYLALDCADEIDEIIEALEQTQWIPCSERLPKAQKNGDKDYSDWVQVTIDIGRNGNNDVYVCEAYYCFSENKWYARRFVIGVVTAWMPLPQPYKAESKTEQALAYADQDTLMSAT